MKIKILLLRVNLNVRVQLGGGSLIPTKSYYTAAMSNVAFSSRIYLSFNEVPNFDLVLIYPGL